MDFNCEKITTFRDVFDYICYDWDHLYTLSKDKDGIFHVNKLSIGPNFVVYKMDSHELEEGLYDKVSQLYEIMQVETREPNSDSYNQLVGWIQGRLDSEDACGSFGLEKVPLAERKQLVKDFEKKGYSTYLYQDSKSIMILEKDA